MMKQANFLFIALLSICSFSVCHALEAPFPTRDKPFAVKDSGVVVPHEYGGPVKWMDNDRVIFSALRKDVPKSYAPEGLHIVIWDTVKNMVTPYANGLLQCYSDGRIIYQTYFKYGAVASQVRRIGEIGKEQEESFQYSPGTFILNHPYNPYSCNTYSSLGYKTRDEIYSPVPERHILRLHENHGYLDLHNKGRTVIEKGPNGRVTIRQVTDLPFVPANKYHIKYYRPGQPPIELGIVRGGITSYLVFSKYANAYVLDQLIPDRKSVELSQPNQFPDGPPAVHLLSPEGGLTTVHYPYGLYNDSNRKANKINITRLGLVIGLPTQSFRPMLVDTGMLLVRGEKVIKIMDGQVPDFDVSPDGCKVAFPHGELSNSSYSFTIKMIDVCSNTN